MSTFYLWVFLIIELIVGGLSSGCGSGAEDDCRRFLDALCTTATRCNQAASTDDCTLDIQNRIELADDKTCNDASEILRPQEFEVCLSKIKAMTCESFIQMTSENLPEECKQQIKF